MWHHINQLWMFHSLFEAAMKTHVHSNHFNHSRRNWSNLWKNRAQTHTHNHFPSDNRENSKMNPFATKNDNEHTNPSSISMGSFAIIKCQTVLDGMIIMTTIKKVMTQILRDDKDDLFPCVLPYPRQSQQWTGTNQHDWISEYQFFYQVQRSVCVYRWRLVDWFNDDDEISR